MKKQERIIAELQSVLDNERQSTQKLRLAMVQQNEGAYRLRNENDALTRKIQELSVVSNAVPNSSQMSPFGTAGPSQGTSAPGGGGPGPPGPGRTSNESSNAGPGGNPPSGPFSSQPNGNNAQNNFQIGRAHV